MRQPVHAAKAVKSFILLAFNSTVSAQVTSGRARAIQPSFQQPDSALGLQMGTQLVILSRPMAIPTRAAYNYPSVFSKLGLARQVQSTRTDEVARNGAL